MEKKTCSHAGDLMGDQHENKTNTNNLCTESTHIFASQHHKLRESNWVGKGVRGELK